MRPAGMRWPAREGGGCLGRTGQERSTGGVKTDRLDPDVAALALSQSAMLRSTIEAAGAVRDLVYGLLTRHAPVFRITNKMFTDAIDALGEDPDGGDFAMALGAAGTVPDEIVVEIKDIIQSEVEGSLARMAYWGANQAVADSFSAAFPYEANALAKPSSDLPGSTARLDHLSMLAEVFQAAVNRGSLGWPLKGRAGEVFDQAADAAALRAADEAWDAASHVFSLAAAASAVMLMYMPDDPRDFLRHTAPLVCRDLYDDILLAGGTQELALSIPAAVLEGAREYPGDGSQAASEVAVRGIRLAHEWTSSCAATSVFRTVSGMAAGAAWATAGDRGRFESMYGQALDAAGWLDLGVHYAFDHITKYSWKVMPRNEFHEDSWRIFSKESGRTVAEWVEVAKGLDYQAIARVPENAALIGTYGTARNGISENAARVALEMQKTGR